MVRGSEGVKRIVPALVMALLAALILSGCRASTAPETPSAARRLSCAQPSSLAGLSPAGGAKVAMCRTDESGAVTTVELVDIDADSVAAEKELDGEWALQQQSFCDKRIALCDREHNMWQLLSPNLADLGTVKVETCDGYFSYDAKSYYFLRDDVLCRTELESGETQAVELDYDLRFLDIAAFDASGSRMLAHFYLSPYSSKCGSAIFDPVTGEFYLLCAERYQAVFSDEEIKSGFGTSGCTYERGAWQNIALDIRLAYELDGIVCHELWHATENHILSCDYSLFTVEGWAQLNPQGFSYYEGYDYSDPDSRRWTYYSGGDEGVYFVDGYSRTFASEDRARIMEFFMTRDDDAQELIKSPAIKKKLQHMSSAVRSVFDTSGWESVRWERLL